MGGILFSRSAASELELPRELQDATVSEDQARSSGPLRVLSCPRCQKRLCALSREGQGESAAWKASASRVERALFGGGSSLKCRMCGQGRVTVETLGDASKTEADPGIRDDHQPTVRMTLKSTGRNAFRPFSVCVCGMYESVVSRAASLLQAEAITKSRQLNVAQRTYKRSELAKLTEDELPKPPVELLVIAHKISGQRNPITDQHGLYNNLLKHAWSRADVVLLILFDVPPNYFSQLLSEQQTLRGLLCAGRLLPLFCHEDANSTDQVDPEADEAASSELRLQEEVEAAGWLVRCLDARVPRNDSLPADNGKSSEVASTLDAALAAAKEGSNRDSRADTRKRRDPQAEPRIEDVDAGTAGASCTIEVLAQVAYGFDGQPLVKD